MQYFDPKKGLTAEALAAIVAQFPGATVSRAGSGVVNIPGIGDVDVGRNFGSPSAQWWWGSPSLRGPSPDGGTPSGAGGAGTGGTGAGAGTTTGLTSPQVGGVNLNIDDILGGDIWNDPSLSLLEQLSRYRLDELFQPVEDPFRDQFFEMLQQRMTELQTPVDDPYRDEFLQALTQRMGELNQYPWTEGEESTLRTSATDRLQRDRQAAHEEMDRRLAQMGHGQGSGTVVSAHQEVDRQFDEMYNAQQQGFDVYALETVNQRKDQAVQLGGLATTAEEAARLETQQRLDQAMGLGATSAQLSQSVRDEEQARRREALTIAALFPELQGQQLNQALAVLQGSPYTGPSIFSQMMQLATIGNQQQQYGQNQNNALWSGLGVLLGNMSQQQATSYAGYSQPNYTTGLDWSSLPGTAYGLNF